MCQEYSKGKTTRVYRAGKWCVVSAPAWEQLEKQIILALVFAVEPLQKQGLGPSNSHAHHSGSLSCKQDLAHIFPKEKGQLARPINKKIKTGVRHCPPHPRGLAPLLVAEALNRTPGPHGGICYHLRSCRRKRGRDCKVEEKHSWKAEVSWSVFISNYNRVLDNTSKSQGEIPTMLQTCKDAGTSIRNQGYNNPSLDHCHDKSHRAAGQIEVQIRMRRDIVMFWIELLWCSFPPCEIIQSQ